MMHTRALHSHQAAGTGSATLNCVIGSFTDLGHSAAAEIDWAEDALSLTLFVSLHGKVCSISLQITGSGGLGGSWCFPLRFLP